MTATILAPATPSTWDIDITHSSVGFSVRHLVISKVRGRFNAWSGSIVLDNERPEMSRVDVKIDAASIDTHMPQRDDHLRSADFLNAAVHPEIMFKSSLVEAITKDRYKVSGELTIAGVTKPVVLDVESLGQTKDPWGGQRAGYSATTKIDRSEFGLTWNAALETGGVVVGNELEINLEIEAVQRAA